MPAELHVPVTAPRTSPRAPAGVEAGGLDLRPALLARYRDLTSLRYDFPLVLVHAPADGAALRPLSDIMDAILRDLPHDDDRQRVASHVRRLERQLRALVAQGGGGLLSALWDVAAGQLGPHVDDLLRDSLSRARAALTVDGDVVDCHARTPARVLTHLWTAAHEQKTRRLRGEIRRLVLGLSDILRAAFAASDAGRTAGSLRESIGPAHGDVFDFDAMSRVLASVSSKAALTEGRRTRIRALIGSLESQRFCPMIPGEARAGTPGVEPFDFTFETCGAALAAYRSRLPALAELTRAMAAAELEIAGAYRESSADSLFGDVGADGSGIDPRDLALFPEYLVRVNADTMGPAEQATLMELLSSDLPVKVLLQTDDLLAETPAGAGRVGFGLRNRQIASMTVALNDTYVYQSAASDLGRGCAAIVRGLEFAGPALFSVFSGATATMDDVPPYLVAALATESRAFPAFTYDPSAGPDWASRFSVEANPQADHDWPTRVFTYEDEHHQSLTEDVALTAADFIACDRRYASHFTRVPRSAWSEARIPVHEASARDDTTPRSAAPSLWMVDGHDTLCKVLVDPRVLRDTRRCRQMWRSLQELGGIHNSHVDRQLARLADDLANRAAAIPEVVPAAAAAAAPSVPLAAVIEAIAPASGDPYIETPRCTTCNECTRINNKMFAYNENKQAYVANPAAGTYAQLVEAAESCQVSIIHPGQPRDLQEPGLDALRARAAPFL